MGLPYNKDWGYRADSNPYCLHPKKSEELYATWDNKSENHTRENHDFSKKACYLILLLSIVNALIAVAIVLPNPSDANQIRSKFLWKCGETSFSSFPLHSSCTRVLVNVE